MARQQRRDTAPELSIRRRLHAAGLRYRVNAPLPTMPRRRADILFPRRRVAVFIDGCFWHGCPEHGTWPQANAVWWREKLGRNVARDRETDMVLQSLEWTVLRAWEHEDPDVVTARIITIVQKIAFGVERTRGV